MLIEIRKDCQPEKTPTGKSANFIVAIGNQQTQSIITDELLQALYLKQNAAKVCESSSPSQLTIKRQTIRLSRNLWDETRPIRSRVSKIVVKDR